VNDGVTPTNCLLHKKEQAMRLISVQKLDPHMKLAKPIFYRDTLVLKQGCTDLNRFAKKLSNLGINYVYVNDEVSDGIDIPDVVSSSTRHSCRLTLQNTIKNYMGSDTLDVSYLTDSITQLLDEILENKDVMLSLKDIGSTDESTYIHCISTTIYSLILATALGYQKDMLKKLAMGTLLHDIGKLLLDSKIIFKTGSLSDEEFNYVKSHTTLGYEALKKCSTLTELSRIIALSHHEKLNGSGYPNHVNSSDLHPFIRIVTIADVYDALTSDRCYRKHWTAKQAFDHLIEFSGTLYDTEFVRVFLQHISIYPNGSIVRLSDGHLAIVKKQNDKCPERPIIRVIANPSGALIKAYELNLLEYLTITIVESELDLPMSLAT